ncbi:NADH-quinone oxidoreductase subunit N [Thalassoglobus polymorphus]|uniref:NADH-quinone oxidoreductase subunit N n=1 Tax=Thalassoglobus polymorphus TaxID=2527994 RepID=A0A517QTK5_9PLAN|nr:NADH-quinone oxidoreductase subunit N [Thalassoglobus polymorphus]QDT34963.1 NADH-quinone oxidoreductase subunit N [Thalassoglobus polymorphus]
MPVQSILDQVLKQEIPRSLEIFAPELVLCVTVVLLLLWRMLGLHSKAPTCWIALFGSLLAFFGAFAQFMYLKSNGVDATEGLKLLFSVWPLSAENVGTPGPYFTGLLMHDQFAVFFRLGLSLFLVLLIALTILTGIPDEEDGQDFYTLLIGSTIGMLMAVGSNHLLMLFISIEMMSVPSYVMVAFQKGRRQATEAALKYVVYGAGIAGVMLYGISLIAGLLGTADMSELGARFALLLGDEKFTMLSANSVTLVLGIMMVLIGLAFKLSLVPFHFWCPDAFEGASSEVCAFLSVASKAAAFALLVRFVMAFQGAGEELLLFFGVALGVISIVTMTLGNLAAYTQVNIKRLLAYSTIAHAGYMVMGVSALLVVVNSTTKGVDANTAAVGCVEGLMYYICVYLFMNLSAFAVVAFLRNETFSEEIDSYRGIFHNNAATKVICVCLGISFFSLVGMPPFGGFFAKMMIFYSAIQAGYVHWFLWVVLAFGALNTVFSLFYYLKVLKAIFISEPESDTREVAVPGMAGAYVLLVTLPILALGMTPLQGDLSATAQYVADVLFK